MDIDIEQSKKCSKCLEIKEFSEFYLKYCAKVKKNYPIGECKICLCNKFKEKRAKANPPVILVPTRDKICSKCNESKDVMFFHHRKSSPDGYRGACKSCIKLPKINKYPDLGKKKCAVCKEILPLEMYHKNKECVEKNWGLGRPSRCKICSSASSRKYRINNPEKVKESYKKSDLKKKSQLKYRIVSNLRANLRNKMVLCLKGSKKSGSSIGDLGCTVSELILYLESLFTEGMSWDNYGREGWHIDHIEPFCSFDVTKRGDLLKVCHYTNLRPLWAKDNLKKAAEDSKKSLRRSRGI